MLKMKGVCYWNWKCFVQEQIKIKKEGVQLQLVDHTFSSLNI